MKHSLKGLFFLVFVLTAHSGFGATVFETFWKDFTRIANINKHLFIANEAFSQRKYMEAAIHYSILVDSFKIDEPKAIMQCGHAYFYAGRKRAAYQYYSRLVKVQNKKLQSIAWQQLGFMASARPAQALAYFRNSLHANPDNDISRYNYELLKLLNPKADPIKRPQKQDGQNQEQKEVPRNKLTKGKKGEKSGSGEEEGDDATKEKPNKDGKQSSKAGDDPGKAGNKDKNQDDKSDEGSNKKSPTTKKADGKGKNEAPDSRSPDITEANKEELAKLKMSQAQAQALLDAMKNSEIQYLQQKKYPKTGKPKNLSKPTW